MTTYARLIEHNESTGEAWCHYIPIPGNEAALDLLGRVVDVLNDSEEGSYELDRGPIPEAAVDTLVEYANMGNTYMAEHTKLTGVLMLPPNLQREIALTGNVNGDPLYKGSVTEYMHEG